MHKPQTYRHVWHQTLNLATSTSSLLTFRSMIWFNKCDWSIPSTSEPDRPGCQCWGEMPNSQQGGQCSALPHTGHFSVWSSCTSHIPQSCSGCTSHLWETPRCWIPNMAREHSSFKTESPSLWHRSVDSVFQTLCSSWELVFVCMDGALFHTQKWLIFLLSTLSWALSPPWRTGPHWDVCVHIPLLWQFNLCHVTQAVVDDILKRVLAQMALNALTKQTPFKQVQNLRF